MFTSNTILQLYASVLYEDISSNKILERDIRSGVRDMAYVYSKDRTDFGQDKSNRKFTDFNIAGFRCAYLHKYAPLHTYIVLDVMTKILNHEVLLFKNMINSKEFKLCCLGGGPGSDAVGVLAALHTVFASSFNPSVIIIDSMEQWKYTFGLVMKHLQHTGFNIKLNFLQWDYIGADLLKYQNTAVEVDNAINTASLITMVKFISAATCTDTEPMVEKIFRMMRPGALVLFIDNAAGGFTQVIERAGKKSNFKIIAGPYRHMGYSNEDLKMERFGHVSCFQTRVTIILLQKPGNYHAHSPAHSTLSSQNIPTKKVPLRDVQNINNLLSQEKINKPLLRDEGHRPSQPSSASHSIPSSKRTAPLSPSVHSSKKPSLQVTQELNKSLLRSSNNNIRPSTSRCITNENRIRPTSNIIIRPPPRSAKINNASHQPKRINPQARSSQRFTPQAPSRTHSRGSDTSTRPFISEQQASEPDNCCSCCVIC